MTNTTIRRYEVIEDNAGGLTLIVFAPHGYMPHLDKGIADYVHSGYECTPDQLLADLDKIANGANPSADWDGNADDPQAAYETFAFDDYLNGGWCIIADNDGVYHDCMGAAGQIAFAE